MKVLVVDDHSDTTWSTATIMGHYGHETQMALDGYRALEIAANFCPQVVILDIGLPVLNGIEVAKRLREMFYDILIIGVTGHHVAATPEFDYCLIKPADPRHINSIIQGEFHEEC